MTALLPQIIEPASNVVRLGPEAASQLQRKASAAVLFANPSGVSNTIAPNAPAIPWTSGFGSGAPAPTTAGTVDLRDFAGRWVTFLLAGANLSTQPMYVCKVTDWAAIAGPAGGRTVIPLDVWELHSWHYCGLEFAGEQALPNSGRYTASGGVAVAASTDVTTHGDYGTQHITFPIAYAASLVPAVTATPEDAAFVATVSNIDNTGFDVRVRRLRPLTAPIYGELDMTIPGGGTTNAIDALVSYGVTYDAAPVIQVEVVGDPSGVDGESQYQASLHDRGTSDFWAVIFHMPHPRLASAPLTTSTDDGPTSLMYGPANVNPASTTPIPTGGVNLVSGATPVTGNPNLVAGVSPTTGDQSQGHVHPENTLPGNTGDEDRSHHHDVGGHQHNEGAHDHDTGDHVHRMNNHDHTVDVFPDEASARTLRVGWTAQGQQHADATHVPVSWIARG